MVLRVPSGRAAWLADGAEEGFCNYLEVTDAYHIATAAIHEMDVLLTWNCRHMANRFTIPKTVAVVTKAGCRCPAIVTPENYLKEDLDE